MGMLVYFLLTLAMFPLSNGSLLHVCSFFILVILKGIIGMVLVVSYSCISDVVDLNEYKTDVRREGSFFSLVFFLQKVALSVAIAAASYILAAAHYQAGLTFF